MPKPSKVRPKQKVKPKGKVESQSPSFIASKPYWIVLTVLLVVVSAVFGGVLGFDWLRSAVLMVMVAVLIGTVGFIYVSKSALPFSKRATFIFAGASVIGFCIWAAFAVLLMPQIAAFGDAFFVVSSLVICLTVGAVIGELLGRIKRVQERLFPQNI
jgi:hypothetical protein